eukprot:scaffold59146_cov17-Tisochrysis_lutea.AAC.1
MQLTKDLNFTAETYGLGAGLFYLGKPSGHSDISSFSALQLNTSVTRICFCGFSAALQDCLLTWNASHATRGAGYSLSMIPSQLMLMKLGANVWLGIIGGCLVGQRWPLKYAPHDFPDSECAHICAAHVTYEFACDANSDAKHMFVRRGLQYLMSEADKRA